MSILNESVKSDEQSNDSEIDVQGQDCCSMILRKLTRPIFPPVSHKYGITVNIQPTKKMNKRHWRLYSHDQQRSILMRIENKFRSLNPSVKLEELHFEVCPTLKNIHFHALYTMPPLFKAELETYYKRICSAEDTKTTKPWRYLDIKLIKGGSKEWIDYIRKDLNK